MPGFSIRIPVGQLVWSVVLIAVYTYLASRQFDGPLTAILMWAIPCATGVMMGRWIRLY